MARLTLARKIAAIVLTIWKKGEHFDPAKVYFTVLRGWVSLSSISGDVGVAQRMVGITMRSLISGLLLIFLSTGANRREAQNSVEEQAVRKLPQAFCDAFTKHDGRALAKIMAEDVDFVTVGALWLHGRADFGEVSHATAKWAFQECHLRESANLCLRFLRPDFAVAHWTWTLQGDRNVDGTARQRRFGMMTMIAEKRNGNWQVDAAQKNDDADPSPAPELGNDVRPVVPIPGSTPTRP